MWIQRLKSRIEAINNNQQSKTTVDTIHPSSSEKALTTLDKKVKELQIKQQVYLKRKGKTVSRGSVVVDAAVATDWVFVNMEDRRTLVTDFVRPHVKDDDETKVVAAVEKIMACKNLASRVMMGGGDPPRILDIKGVVVEAGGAKLVIKTSFVDTK
jgi:hypothetical protein